LFRDETTDVPARAKPSWRTVYPVLGVPVRPKPAKVRKLVPTGRLVLKVAGRVPIIGSVRTKTVRSNVELREESLFVKSGLMTKFSTL
jgi:hypothetical protein